MFFQCVLLLALSLIQNEAADKFSFSQQPDPGRSFRPLSSKHIQGSFDTVAELAKLINKVKKEAAYKKDRFQPIVETSTQKDDAYLPGIFNVIKKKIDNEGIRIHVLKNINVLDKYMKDGRGMFINNPHVLDRYINELKNQKTAVTTQPAGLKSLLKRRNAVFRLDEPEAQVIEDLVKPVGISGHNSKRFNKVSNKETDRKMSRGQKQRDMVDQSREVRKSVTDDRVYKKERENHGLKDERPTRGYKNDDENSGFKNDDENRGFKNERENRGFKERERGLNKREFKDYSEYNSHGNPNLARPKPTKVIDYDYDKPKKSIKTVHRDYDEHSESKKKNVDRFDDYGQGNKKGDSWDKPLKSEPKRKPVPKMDYNEKPYGNMNSERRRPRKDESSYSNRGGSSDHNARSSKNNEGHNFGNTAIPFNRPRNIYANENGE